MIRHSRLPFPFGQAVVLLLVSCLWSSVPAAAARSRPAGGDGELRLVKGMGQLLELGESTSSVVVGDPGVADVKVVTPTMLYVFGLGIGRTDLAVVTQDGTVTAGLTVAVTADAQGANDLLRHSHPDSRLRYEIVGNRLVLSGKASSMDEGMAAQRILDSAADEANRSNEAVYGGERQITLKVRFAEVSRNQITNLGFDWSALFGLGNTTIGLATGAAVGGTLGNAATGTSLMPYATPTVGYSGSKISANLVIEALESRGLVQTIAEPNLTVRSGRTAKFRAGGDIPIPVPQQQGTLSIEYRSFGVSLEFTPVVIAGNRIAIHVVPEVSDISAQNAVSFAGATVPSFTTRRVETDVELASGQTFAIAGMFKRNLQRSRDSLPGVGDLPVLGTLLSSQQYERGETELVVLITPILVEPVDTAAVLPTDQGPAATTRTSPSPAEHVGFLVE